MSMYRFETELCPMCNGIGYLIGTSDRPEVYNECGDVGYSVGRKECPNCKGYGKVVKYRKKDPPKRKKGKKK